MAIKIVSAGAGSGKTYRLTSEMVEFLKGEIRPEGIIATTFTKKAAAELQERVRVRLLQEGLRREAEALTNALIGTVHSLGVKLLQRFAYEAGVSPNVAIIADEDHQLLFNQSLATVLTEERVDIMEHLRIQLGLVDNTYFDWRREVRTLTEVARSNNFSRAVLEKSKVQSFASFLDLLGGEGTQSIEYFQGQLTTLLQQSISQIDTDHDSTKTTRDAIFTLKKYQRELDLRKQLNWRAWAKLGKLKIGAKSKEHIEALTNFARTHHLHPDFQKDIQTFIYQLFDISIAALEEYEEYKKKRGLIDYTDMEVLVSQLLDQESVQNVLKEELDLLMVDEFQDTSPIQLEIFLKLSKFAKASVWVGDPKQSIYGFRGAAPELMQAIIEAEGGIDPQNIQKYSWRSREDVVYATNALFTKAFPELPTDQVALIPKRTIKATADSQNKTDESIEIGDALHHWHFQIETEEGKKTRQPGKPWLENSIAASLKTFLERKSLFFWPKGQEDATLIQPGDVAILCRSNTQCRQMADALHRMGLKAAISRAGLLQSAEAKLTLACLKYVLNRNDSLSVAEILFLTGSHSIEDIIENRQAYLEQVESSIYSERWASEEPIIEQLNAIRKKSSDYSSAETLDLILEELDLRRIAVSWGNIQQRLDNIDRLRYYAQQYEEACNRLYSSSSLGGFLLWLVDLERNEQDMQASGSDRDAVNVLTYHKSKGLEWPLVICHSLDQSLRADIWGLEIMQESPEVNVQDILANRWLRYWVNPYDRSLPGTYLAERVAESEAQKEKTQQALQEESRLLYVGVTRARDYLVFTSAANPTRWLNRTWHEGKDDFPTLSPDTYESPWTWNDKFLNIQTETFIYPKIFTEDSIPNTSIQFWEERSGKKEFSNFEIDPVTEPFLNFMEVQVGDPLNYASALKIPEDTDAYQVAKAIKAFLTAYDPTYLSTEIDTILQELLSRYELPKEHFHSTFLNHAKQWKKYLLKLDNELIVYKKIPLQHLYQQRHFSTVIDFVLIGEQRIFVIQNSGLTGSKKRWKDKAMELSSWFYLVKEGLQAHYPNHRITIQLNLVTQGAIIPLEYSKQ